MLWGNRARPLAVLALSLSALTGCGAVDDYAGWSGTKANGRTSSSPTISRIR